MGDQEAMTVVDGVGDGEGIAAADSEPALWVAEFDARLEAQERAWRRERWWGWARMGVGNWVVASVYLWIVEFPIFIPPYGVVDIFVLGPPAFLQAEAMAGTGGPWTMVDAIYAIRDAFPSIVLPGLVLGPVVWLFALALSYANVRVRRTIATRGQG